MKGRPCVHPGCSMPRPTLGSSHNAHVRHNNKVPPHDNTNSPPPGALYYPVLTLVLHTTTLYYAVLHRTTIYEVALQTTTLYYRLLPCAHLGLKPQTGTTFVQVFKPCFSTLCRSSNPGTHFCVGLQTTFCEGLHWDSLLCRSSNPVFQLQPT